MPFPLLKSFNTSNNENIGRCQGQLNGKLFQDYVIVISTINKLKSCLPCLEDIKRSTVYFEDLVSKLEADNRNLQGKYNEIQRELRSGNENEYRAQIQYLSERQVRIENSINEAKGKREEAIGNLRKTFEQVLRDTS